MLRLQNGAKEKHFPKETQYILGCMCKIRDPQLRTVPTVYFSILDTSEWRSINSHRLHFNCLVQVHHSCLKIFLRTSRKFWIVAKYWVTWEFIAFFSEYFFTIITPLINDLWQRPVSSYLLLFLISVFTRSGELRWGFCSCLLFRFFFFFETRKAFYLIVLWSGVFLC